MAISFCVGVGYALWSMGDGILRTGVYDYTLETSGGRRPSGFNKANVKREHVHATGDWAREQGIGFEALGVTLAFWGALILWGMLGPLALRSAWSVLHSLLTLVSLGGCVTAVAFFFPPWRLGPSMSCNAFYLVIASMIYLGALGALGGGDKVKARSQKIFPALIGSAVVLGAFWSGYGVGIIAGMFIGFVLATHVVLLIPSVRAKLWTPGERSRTRVNR